MCHGGKTMGFNAPYTDGNGKVYQSDDDCINCYGIGCVTDADDFEESFKDWCATTHPTELLDNVIYMLIQLKEDWEDDDDSTNDEYKEIRKHLVGNTIKAITLMAELQEESK